MWTWAGPRCPVGTSPFCPPFLVCRKETSFSLLGRFKQWLIRKWREYRNKGRASNSSVGLWLLLKENIHTQYEFRFFFDVDRLSLYWVCYKYCFCFSFWFFGLEACGILSPWPRIQPAPSALEGEVLHHWTTREFLNHEFRIFEFFCRNEDPHPGGGW